MSFAPSCWLSAWGPFIAGLAGSLLAHYFTYVDSETFNILVAVEILMFVVVGGGGHFLGACFLARPFCLCFRSSFDGSEAGWS